MRSVMGEVLMGDAWPASRSLHQLHLDGGRVNEARGWTAEKSPTIPIRAIGCLHGGSMPQLASRDDPSGNRLAGPGDMRVLR